MRDALQALTEQFAASPWLLLAAGFLVAFLEAVAIVGLVVPGIFLLFLIAALVGWDLSAMLTMSVAFALGAMAGDGLSYALGRRYRGRLEALPAASRSGRWLESGRAFFGKHGGRSVFIARFVGPVRPIVPLVAGSLGMPVAAFVPRMVLACLVWAPAMVVPGALFGQSLELAAEFGTRLVVLLIVLVLGGWLLISLVRWGYAWASRRSTWWLKRLGAWLRRHPRFGRLAGPLLVPGQREVIPVLGLAAVLLVSSTLLLTVLTLAIVNAPTPLSSVMTSVTLSGSLRTPLADPVFVALGLAGSAPVALTLAIGVALFLAATGRSVALVHWLLAVVLGTALAMGLDASLAWLPVRVAGPDVPFASLTLMYGFAALVAAKDLAATQRKWLYLGSTAVLVLIGFARLYLGMADLYALGVSAALAVTWLTLVGIAYRVRASARRPRSAWLLVAVFLLLAVGGSAVANALGYSRALQGQQQGPVIRTVDASCWWATGRSCEGRRLPERRTVFGDERAQRFDVQLAASEESFIAALDADGWQALPPLNPRGLRTVFSRRGDPERLPHLPRDFNGRTQEIGRRMPLDGQGEDGRWAVLRAWRSGWRLTPDERPVWLIQVRVVEPATVAGLFATWRRDDDAVGEGLEALRRAGSDWRWRQADGSEAWRAYEGSGVEGPLRDGGAD